MNCSLTFVIGNTTEKNRSIFFHRKVFYLFQKNFVFNTLLGPKEDLSISTVIVRRPVGPLQNVPSGLPHSILREKTGQKLLSLGR